MACVTCVPCVMRFPWPLTLDPRCQNVPGTHSCHQRLQGESKSLCKLGQHLETATRRCTLHITTLALDINKISGLNITSIWLKNTKYHHLCSFSWISESLQVSSSLKAFCHSTSLDSQLGLAVWQLKIRRSIHKASQQFEALPQRPHLHKSKMLKDH